jgi:hypothetical protein
MSFYNIEIRLEDEFVNNYPKLYEIIEKKLKENKVVDDKNTYSSSDDFKEMIGFIHPTKGQCYEVSYRRSSYSYGHGRMLRNIFLECHLKNEEIVIDNLHIDKEPEY